MATIGGIVVSTGGAPATSRRRLIDVVDELARTVNAADPKVRALAGDSFRAAVRTMNRMGMWPWELLDEDVTISTNKKFSTITSAVKKPLAMHLLTGAAGTRNQKMSYMTYDRFVEKYSVDYSSEPHTYTIPNLFETGQIRWFPTPSANYNARFTYYRVTPAPRSEQETIEIPETAIETYMSFAWYEFLKRLPSEQRPFPITIAMADRKDAFKQLAAHVNAPGDRTRQVSTYGSAGGLY